MTARSHVRTRSVVVGWSALAVVGLMLTAPAAVAESPVALPDTASTEAFRGALDPFDASHHAESVAAAKAAAERAAAEAAAKKAAAEAAAKKAAAEAAAKKAAASKPAPKPAAKPAASRPSTHPSRSDRGVLPSTYTGSYYVPGAESIRKCIVRRESGGNYQIVSGNGYYHGAYQMGRPFSRAAAAKMGRPDLAGIPASRWSRVDQDTGFWLMWNFGSGRFHWAGGNYNCW